MARVTPRRPAFRIGGIEVEPGRRREVGLPIARLVTGADVSLPVMILHGRRDGPIVWVDAAIHGDEVNGVEIIGRVLASLDVRRLAGTLVAVPIVNVHGFMSGDRYLPDRRDLNRLFPGSARGSLGARIAHLMMSEVVERSALGIDLHTGSDHRTNLPHVRADLDDPETRRLAAWFGAPLMVHSQIRDGSLRQAGRAAGARVLVYEAGEAWRFDQQAIDVGVRGILRLLALHGMVDPADAPEPGGTHVLESRRSRWVRAQRTGILRLDVEVGTTVAARAPLGVIHDSFGRRLGHVRAATPGIVIGVSRSPLVNRGDALVHVADIDASIALADVVPDVAADIDPTDDGTTA